MADEKKRPAAKKKKGLALANPLYLLVRVAGVEPATPCSGDETAHFSQVIDFLLIG